MKGFLSFLIGLIFLGLVIYFVPSLHAEAARFLTYNQCDTPMSYKLGSLDSRFGLSTETALSDIKSATDIWNSAEGKQIFNYSANAPLTVNFVYDQRQALDTQIENLNGQLKNTNQNLQQQIDSYNVKVAALNLKFEDFRRQVEEFNKNGGSQDQYNALIQAQKDLNAQADALNSEAKQLNLSTHNYNDSVSSLNRDINRFNTELAQKPEEGLYNGQANTITIYFANNHDELIHTLTHEFGHSMGMDHVTDPNAIMYPYTTSSVTLSPQDLAQLSYICRNQSVFVHAFEVWQIILHNFVQNITSNNNTPAST